MVPILVPLFTPVLPFVPLLVLLAPSFTGPIAVPPPLDVLPVPLLLAPALAFAGIVPMFVPLFTPVFPFVPLLVLLAPSFTGPIAVPPPLLDVVLVPLLPAPALAFAGIVPMLVPLFTPVFPFVPLLVLLAPSSTGPISFPPPLDVVLVPLLPAPALAFAGIVPMLVPPFTAVFPFVPLLVLLESSLTGPIAFPPLLLVFLLPLLVELLRLTRALALNPL